MGTRINKKLVSAFAQALKSIRIEKELTQEQLAYGANVHRTYIAFLEGARKQPSIDAVFKIAKGLDISPAELIEKVDSYYSKKG